MPDIGAIGAACEVPETAAKSKAAAAIAKTVRIICDSSLSANLRERITPQHGGGSATMNYPRNEQTVRIWRPRSDPTRAGDPFLGPRSYLHRSIPI
jgi:hypothetical protein